MAPPPNRRSGYSRRAQYTNFFSYAAGILAVIIGGGLLILSYANPSLFSGLRGVAADAVEPVGAATATGRSGGKDILHAVGGFLKSGSQHAKLQRELEEAKVRLVKARATEVENRRLKALLELTDDDVRPVATARLTSSTAASSRRFAVLSVGANKGVAPGMPVRSDRGLVGRVLEVGANTSRVLLITDSDSLVPVRRARDGVPAFAQGVGDGTIRIRLINLGLNPLRIGDVFVTSGSGGLYRPGTPIAVATKLNPDGAIARILSNPSDTDYVLIDPVWSPETQQAVTDAGK